MHIFTQGSTSLNSVYVQNQNFKLPSQTELTILEFTRATWVYLFLTHIVTWNSTTAGIFITRGSSDTTNQGSLASSPHILTRTSCQIFTRIWLDRWLRYLPPSLPPSLHVLTIYSEWLVQTTIDMEAQGGLGTMRGRVGSTMQ